MGGYTLIYNSHSFALAQHPVWDNLDEELFDSPVLQVVEKLQKRITIGQTDAGASMALEIKDLEDLIIAYRQGLIKEPEGVSGPPAFDPGSFLALAGDNNTSHNKED